MIPSPRRPALAPRVTRHFEFTRLQGQFLALAYQSLVPVVSRHPERPRLRGADNVEGMTTSQGLRSKAGGA
jgi:hypothetical protein